MRYSAEKFTRIAKVANGLNPIWEMMVGLWLERKLTRKEILRRKSNTRQMELYLQFMRDLNYIDIKENVIFPGRELLKFMEKTDMSDPFQYQHIILGEILERGYYSLKKNLHINILTPYVEISSSYYLPSLLSREILRLGGEEIERQYRILYKPGRRKPHYQFFMNLMELSDAGILRKSDDFFEGDQTIYSRLEGDRRMILNGSVD